MNKLSSNEPSIEEIYEEYDYSDFISNTDLISPGFNTSIDISNTRPKSAIGGSASHFDKNRMTFMKQNSYDSSSNEGAEEDTKYSTHSSTQSSNQYSLFEVVGEDRTSHSSYSADGFDHTYDVREDNIENNVNEMTTVNNLPLHNDFDDIDEISDISNLMSSIYEASQMLHSSSLYSFSEFGKNLETLMIHIDSKANIATKLMREADSYWQTSLKQSQAMKLNELQQAHKLEIDSFHETHKDLNISHDSHKHRKHSIHVSSEFEGLHQQAMQRQALDREELKRQHYHLLKQMKIRHHSLKHCLKDCLREPMLTMSRFLDENTRKVEEALIRARCCILQCQQLGQRYIESPHVSIYRASALKSYRKGFLSIRHSLNIIMSLCRQVRKSYEGVETTYGPIESSCRNRQSMLLNIAVDDGNNHISSIHVYPRLLVKTKPTTMRKILVKGLHALTDISRSRSCQNYAKLPVISAELSHQHDAEHKRSIIRSAPASVSWSRLPSPIHAIRSPSKKGLVTNAGGPAACVCPSCSLHMKGQGYVIPTVHMPRHRKSCHSISHEFCSWICAKRWVEKTYAPHTRYETLLLIDLHAGQFLDG